MKDPKMARMNVNRPKQAWLPILLSSSIALIGVVFWQMLLAQERAHLEKTITGQAQQVAGLLKENLEERMRALIRMAKRWEIRGGTPQKEWEADVENYIQDNPDYQAIALVDPSFHVRWNWPPEANKEVEDLYLGSEPNHRNALETPVDHHSVTVTQPLDLVQGGKGFLVAVPIFVRNELKGIILGVIGIQEWFDFVLRNVPASQYSVQLFNNGEKLYDRKTPIARYEPAAAQEAEVSVYGVTWRVQACPTQAVMAETTTWLPQFFLAASLLFAFVIGLIVRVTQAATSRLKQLNVVNQELKKEIVERKNIEGALRLAQFTVDCAGDSVYLIEPDARLMYVNEAACQELGYTRSELEGLAVYDIDPDWTPEVWPNFWRTLKEENVVHFVSRHRRKDGSIFPVEITTNYLEFEGKEYDCAVVRDITERLRAETALRESESWFKTLSEAIPQMVWTARPDGSLDYFNQRVLDYFDRSFAQMNEWGWHEALHPDDLPVCLERWAEARELGLPFEMEYRLRRARDQSFRWFIGRALPFRDNKGQIMKWFGTCTDISERKLAEERVQEAHRELENRVIERTKELVEANENLSKEITERRRVEQLRRESEERLRGILDHSPSLIFIKDLQGRYLHINSRFEKVFHLSNDEVFGKTDEEIFPLPQAAQFRENDQRVIEDQIPQEFEETATYEDGTHTSVVSKFPLFDTQGEMYGICGITLDITERTRAEKLLRESQARFQTVFDSAAIGIALVDMSGRPAESNPALQEILGYRGDELCKMVFTEFTHADDAAKDMDLYKELVSGKRNSYQMEKRYIKKGGRLVWAQLHVSLVRDANGDPEYAIAMVSDITERKRAEEERLRLLAILENATDFVGMADQNGGLLYINQAGRKMVGCTLDEDIQGTSIADYHPDWANTQILIQGLPTSTRDGFWVAESALLHCTGREIPVSLVVVAHRAIDGHVERFSAIMRDLTERKQGEEQLKNLSNRLILATKSAQIGIWDWDVVNNVLTWDEQTYALYGITPSDFGGAYEVWRRHVHPDDIQGTEEKIRSALKNEQPFDTDFRVVWADGSVRTLIASALVQRNSAGTAVRMIGMNMDITERKRLEEESHRLNVRLEERVRQRTAELESKNAELERFTYTVSHDLKGPLVTIQGFLNLVKEDIRAGHVEQLEEDLERIEGATRKMQQLLNEVLELSRIGRVVNPPEEVDMGEVVREAVEGIMGPIIRSGVRVDIQPDLPVVFGDRPRLVEVLQNLVENGVKFIGAQPKPRIEIGLRRKEDETVLYVSDNGMGIDSRYHEKVFGLFERLDTETRGTGIGLSLVKRIVEVHGGRIWVESAGLGQGSTFCLVLPAPRGVGSLQYET